MKKYEVPAGGERKETTPLDKPLPKHALGAHGICVDRAAEE